jgi:hypothetical protein
MRPSIVGIVWQGLKDRDYSQKAIINQMLSHVNNALFSKKDYFGFTANQLS